MLRHCLELFNWERVGVYSSVTNKKRPETIERTNISLILARVAHLALTFGVWMLSHLCFPPFSASPSRWCIVHSNSNFPMKSHVFVVFSLLLSLFPLSKQGVYVLNYKTNSIVDFRRIPILYSISWVCAMHFYAIHSGRESHVVGSSLEWPILLIGFRSLDIYAICVLNHKENT